MLYERWRQVAQEFREEVALSDILSGQRWTFGELAKMAETGDSPAERVVFPKGNSSEFVFAVLRAWRLGQVVCPLEWGQTPPEILALPELCVHLKLTSGSTGMSRAVAFTAGQLAADASNIVQTMGLRREWPNIGVISLAHSYGFSNLVLPLLLHGIPLILVPAPLPEMLRRASHDLENFTLAAVPALWRVWHDAGAISAKIRLAISAGAPLPLVLESAVFENFRLKIHNFYGSSECGGIAYDSSEIPRQDGAFAGVPMNNVRLAIGNNGCLEVQGAAVGETYWPESNDNLARGVFRTSDLAEINEGKVFLRGRASDQINVAGRKISPEAIERSLLKHPAVRECLVFGVPSDEAERTETIVACIARQKEILGEELKQFLLADLPAWQIPRRWWFVDSLETNQRGKLSRAEWRNRYLANEPEEIRARASESLDP